MNNKTEEAVKTKEINYLDVLIVGIYEIRKKLEKRINFWEKEKRNMKIGILMEYDEIQKKRIDESISANRQIINELLKPIPEQVLAITKGVMIEIELANNKISKKHKKEVKLMKNICYKCKNRALELVGKSKKKKEFVTRRINHKTTKKEIEIEEMKNLIGRKDLDNRLKLWNVRFNLLKEKFKSKKEINKYSLDKLEEAFKRKLKKEKKNKLLKVVKQKRKEPLRKRQVDYLVRSKKRNLMAFKKNKRIHEDCSKMVEFHMIEITNNAYKNERRINQFVDGSGLLEINGIPVWYTEEKINRTNRFLAACFNISMRDDMSILEERKIKDPDIDTEDRFCSKWNMIDNTSFLLRKIFPCTLR